MKSELLHESTVGLTSAVTTKFDAKLSVKHLKT